MYLATQRSLLVTRITVVASDSVFPPLISFASLRYAPRVVARIDVSGVARGRRRLKPGIHSTEDHGRRSA